MKNEVVLLRLEVLRIDVLLVPHLNENERNFASVREFLQGLDFAGSSFSYGMAQELIDCMHQKLWHYNLEPPEVAELEEQGEVVANKDVDIRQQPVAEHGHRRIELYRVATTGHERGTQARPLHCNFDCGDSALGADQSVLADRKQGCNLLGVVLVQGEAVVCPEATNDLHSEFRLNGLEQHLTLKEVYRDVLESPAPQCMLRRFVDCEADFRMENLVQVVGTEAGGNVPGDADLCRHKSV